MKAFFSYIWEILKIVVIALIIVVPIRYFVFQPFFVRGESMEPNFQDGNYLIIDEISYRIQYPERGDVIVFIPPNDSSQKYIKRIIGLPNETVEIKNGKVKVLNENGWQSLDESKYLPGVLTNKEDVLKLGTDEYYVLGDNRSSSADSRVFGAVARKNIIGKVAFRILPINEVSAFTSPEYTY